MLGAILWLVVFALLARWVLEAWNPRGPALGDGSPGEVKRLRDEVDALSAEVRRLSEEQSFLLRLLSDGGTSPGPRLPAPPETPDPEKP